MAGNVFRRNAISLIVAASACCSLNAQAQLEEVIVTAQKRTQSLQDVPMAVSAMGAQQLQDAGIQTLADVSLYMPTLEVNTTTAPVNNIYRIRRLGNLANVPSVEPAVAIMVDGAFRGRPIFGAGDMFDVERIEVLRGPQSTLYGKNATAGVVAIHTQLPSEEFEWKAELTAGVAEGGEDADLYRFKGGISGALSDSVRASLGVSLVDEDEVMGNGYKGGLGLDSNENKRLAIRGQIAWDASDKLSVRAIAGYMNVDDAVGTANDISIDPTSPLVVGIPEAGLPPVLETAAALAQGPAGLCADNDAENNTGCNLADARTDLDAWEGTLLVNYELDNGWSIDSTTSWDWYEFDGPQNDVAQSSSLVLQYNPRQESESWQQELRLTSAGGEFLDWQLGAFYYHNEFYYGDKGDSAIFLADVDSGNPLWAAILGDGLPFDLPWATPGQLGYLDGRQDSDYYAVFAQGIWNFTDDFSVTTGVRWQQEEKDMDIDQSVNDPGFSVISALLSPVAIGWVGGSDDRDSDEITWSISPQYNINDDTMVYATASHGWKSGGFDIGFGAGAADDREFDDEKLMHYELGLKSEFWDGRARMSASAFYTDIDDYQDPLFVGGQFVIRSVDSASLKGVELDSTVLLTDKLTADFAISYVDFEYDDYENGACWPGGAGCDLSGETPLNAPKTKANIGLTYQDDVSWGGYYLSGNVAYTDDYRTTQAESPSNLDQDAFYWLTLRAGTTWDQFELVAWIDNATDEEVVSFAAPLSLLGDLGGNNSYQTFLRAPRSYGLTFRVNY